MSSKGLGVGIASDVYIQSAELDKDNYFNITFKQVSDTSNPYDKLLADDVVEGNDELTVKLFAPNPRKNEEGKFTQAKLADFATQDLNKTKGILQHIMSGYVTKEEYLLKGSMFDGTGMDKTNYAERLNNKEVLLQIHKNMCAHFVTVMSPFFADETKLFRLLLVRTSKDKHFATFRGTYIEENPFWESMDVPVGASKIKFTAYEEREGLNDPTIAARSSSNSDKTKTPDANQLTAASVFGGQ